MGWLSMAIEYLQVISENIPTALKNLKQWVVWKPETRKGQEKPSKVSYSIQINTVTGNTEEQHAAVNNPDTWMTFDDALALLKAKRKYKGLNFVFPSVSVDGEFQKIVGVDLDHVSVNNVFNPEKIKEIEALNTYAEVSPSGTGLRAICFAEFPAGEEVHKGDIEVYQAGKFLSITGHKLANVPETVNESQAALTAFRAKYFKLADKLEEAKLPTTPVQLTDIEIINKLLNSSRQKLATAFRSLYLDGNTKTSAGIEDHSAADFNLCGLIVYWTQDAEQIDRIFRQSKLMRPKWDSPDGFINSESVTYGARTIYNILRNRKLVYKGEMESEQEEVDLYPYKITTEGIFKAVASKTNPDEVSDVRISSTPCKIIAIGDNIDTREILYKLCITDAKKREKIYWKTGEDLLTRAGALNLIKDGMLFKESSVLDIENLFDSYIHTVAEGLPEELTASKSGWKRGHTSFVVGNYEYSAEGVKPILQMENNTAELYIKKGSLDEWRVGAEIMLKYDAVRFKFYASCTPMLLSMLNVSSYLQEQCAPSGQLKTLTGWLCASIWGNPIPLQINARSTPKGIEAFVGFNTDLPTFIDETSTNEKEIKELIYTIANGIGRGTSNKNHGYEMPKTWSTVALTTGENPILPTNAKMGQLVRNVPLKGGVDEKLDEEIVATAESAIVENYGHFRELYIKKVFQYKAELKTIYNKFRVEFPRTEDITSERAKKFYATIATAGLLVEEVFKDLGIEHKDPFEVVDQYFGSNVMSSTVFVPDYMRALEAVYSWFDANRIYFEESEDGKEINHERYGWIRDKYICFNPNKIEEFVTKAGYNYLGCLEEWRKHEIILTRTKRNDSGTISVLPKTQLKIDGHVIQVIKIPMRADEDAAEIKEADDRENKESGGMKKATKHKSPTQGILNTLNAYGQVSEVIKPVENSLVVSADEMAAFLEDEEDC
jgi:uncharacterized protein (DUF927 family)